LPAPNEIALLALAAWRLAHLLVHELGPFDIFDHLRRLANVWDETGKLFACVWCMSLWTSALMLLAWQFQAGRVIVTVLALSALAIAIQTLIGGQQHG
jgi:hypothetical protein